MTNLRLYNTNGTLSGHYVYTLICQEDGPLYIKVGISANPLLRFRDIRNGNPITPITLACLDVATRDLARAIECDLHMAAEEWHHSLEWFKVVPEEFSIFRQACAQIVEKHSSPSRPKMKWAHVDCSQMIKDTDARRARHFLSLKAKGAAYADFVAAGGRVKSA